MKKQLKAVIAIVLCFIMLTFVMACVGDDNEPTKNPGNVSPDLGNTPGNTGSVLPSPNGTEDANASAELNGTDELTGTDDPASTDGLMGTDDPEGTDGDKDANSDTQGNGRDIEGFVEGMVLDEEEAPEVVSAVERHFSGHQIQSITFENYEGRHAYKVTLQGEGELARNIYVLGDGTIVMPSEGD